MGHNTSNFFLIGGYIGHVNVACDLALGPYMGHCQLSKWNLNPHNIIYFPLLIASYQTNPPPFSITYFSFSIG